jgi:hypothetical protein
MNSNGIFHSGVSVPSKITRGVRFSTIDGGLPILRNEDWSLWILPTGNLLIMYGAENNSKSTQITNYTFENYSFFTFTFEHNGQVYGTEDIQNR